MQSRLKNLRSASSVRWVANLIREKKVVNPSAKIPLPLFKVLEEEFIALHGPPREDVTVIKIKDSNNSKLREVTSTYDWEFHPSHLKNPNQLVLEFEQLERNRLQRSHSRYEMDPDELAKKNWLIYLKEKLKLSDLPTRKDQWDEKSRQLLAERLNSLLRDRNLFGEERFSTYWLSPETEKVKESLDLIRDFGDDDDWAHFNRLLLEDAFPGCFERVYEVRLAAVYKRIHEKPQAALCLSGGGIRSGTFALGLFQGLARKKLLDQFHYLSTVSGGGYIGSWLAAWIHRHPEGVAGVASELAHVPNLRKVDPDPSPIRYLRTYSNFITPKVGLLSADTWSFVGIYLRNLYLNWIVFIPFLLFVGMLPRLVIAVTLAQPRPDKQYFFDLNQFGIPFRLFGRHGFLLLGFLLTTWVLAFIIFNRPAVRDELRQNSPKWRERTTQRSFIVYCLLPLTLAAFSLTTYWAWSSERTDDKAGFYGFLIFGPVFGLGVTLLAWFIGCRVLRRIGRQMKWSELFTSELTFFVLAGIFGGIALWLFTRAVRIDRNSGLNFWSDGFDWNWLTWKTELYAVLGVPIFMLVFLLGATLFIGVTSASSRVDDEDREWWARLCAWVLIVILGWAIFTALIIFAPLLLLSSPKLLATFGGLSGIVAALIGQSALTRGASNSKGDATGKAGLLSSLGSLTLPLMATIFIAVLLIGVSLATTAIFQGLAYVMYSPEPQTGSIGAWLLKTLQSNPQEYLQRIYLNVGGRDSLIAAKTAHMSVLHHTSLLFNFLLALVMFGLTFFFSRLINLNIFSLHGGYRNRLIRAFLGASRPEGKRKPNPFTGFDPADNLSMHELRVGLFDNDDFLDPVKLAHDLMDSENTISKYLQDNEYLSNVESVPNRTCFSTRLVSAIRKDLNCALQDQELASKFGGARDKSKAKTDSSQRTSPVPVEEFSRSASHILSNRRALENAYPNQIRSKSVSGVYRLMPFINTTLNLVGGKNLAWQQRLAEPFSITPLHSGCFRLGYRDSRFYGGKDGGISLGTAAAISGAAASSNMGYYTTSPVLSLVLTFFNVRLGWWLGNPGPAGNSTFEDHKPTFSGKPVLDEALGLTDDKNDYVYLTDGGHFENLGLFEMVLRRNRYIVISDAAADNDFTFGDLGNAIRKVRIDLGIPIEFQDFSIVPGWPAKTDKNSYYAVARIRYSCVDGVGTDTEDEDLDGWLLYIKPNLLGIEPRDVLEYKKSHPTFPHQTTGDQFFDEPQFESYRILGSHIVEHLCTNLKNPTLGRMIKAQSGKLEPVIVPEMFMENP